MLSIKDYSVFGSTGFVGSNLIARHPLNERVLRDQYACQYQRVIYLISTTHNYHVYDDVGLDVKTNLVHLCEVLRCLRDRSLTEEVEFNFISSWFVYGNVPSVSLPVSEEFKCEPRGFYSITKYAAEQLVQSFAETFGIKYRILRLSNVLGPSDSSFGPQKNAITWMLHQLFSGNQVKLYDDGLPLRDFLHVSDVVDAIALIINNGEFNQIFNVGRGEPTPIGTLIWHAANQLGATDKVISVQAPRFHQQVQSRDMWMNSGKLFDLGFRPTRSIASIVDELLSSFQS